MTDDEIAVAERACERLCLDYAHHADAGEYDAYAALFAEDGELVLAPPGLRGPAAIRAASGSARPEGRVSRHVCSNIRIEVVDAQNAVGTTTLLLFRSDAGEKGIARMPSLEPQLVGTYHDRFRLTEFGWRFAHRHIELAFLKSRAGGASTSR